MKGLNIIYGEYTLEDGLQLGDYGIKNLSTLELQPKAIDYVVSFQDIKTGKVTQTNLENSIKTYKQLQNLVAVKIGLESDEFTITEITDDNFT